jgi:hypothetical protein
MQEAKQLGDKDEGRDKLTSTELLSYPRSNAQTCSSISKVMVSKV